MIIHIDDLKFQAIIGILDFERKTPQDVVLNIAIEYEFDNDFIDYAKVVDMIKKDMLEKKYLLIENALDGISSILFENFTLIKKLDIKLTKPSILKECQVSVSDSFFKEN